MATNKTLGALIAAGILASTSAGAVSIGYRLVIDGSGANGFDSPTLTLTNQSDTASIINMMLTIGQINFNFDFASNITGPTGGGVTFNMPDLVNGGGRSNVIDADFTGFTPSNEVSFSVDIDSDSGDSTVDFRSILFNNPGSQNSMLFVSFSGGSYLTTVLPDAGGTPSSIYTFLGSQELASTGPGGFAVPVPASVALLAAGLVGIGVTRRYPRIP